MAAIPLLSILASKAFFVTAGFAGLCFLVAFHEFGHFIFCKIFGIRTPSFSIGFGPRLFSKKIGDTVFAFSAIPLGGYVEIAGAEELGQGEQKESRAKDSTSFPSKPYYQKMLVLSGGILFNLIFAYCALTLLFATGIPQSPLLYPKNSTTTIKSVVTTGPADQAGLKAGDIITQFNNIAIADNPTLIQQIRNMPDTATTITIMRDQKTLDLPITVGTLKTGLRSLGYLGVEFELKDIAPLSFIESLKEGVATTHAIVIATFNNFKQLFAAKTTNGLGGPLMVISQTMKGAQQGFKIFLLLLAIISINLAVLNVIPLPILDGGQALLYTIEALLGRELPSNLRFYIHATCWILMLLLIVYLSFNDLSHFLRALGR